MIGVCEELSETLSLILEEKNEKPKKPENKFNRNDKRSKELTKCIAIHLKLKDLAADVSEIFGNVVWMDGFLSVILFCTALFASTVVRTIFLDLNINVFLIITLSRLRIIQLLGNLLRSSFR